MFAAATEHLKLLLRSEPLLVLRFTGASIGRMVLAMSSILLMREFLAGVLGDEGGLAELLAQSVGVGAALWIVAGLFGSSYVASTLLAYDSQVTQQRISKVLELG